MGVIGMLDGDWRGEYYLVDRAVHKREFEGKMVLFPGLLPPARTDKSHAHLGLKRRPLPRTFSCYQMGRSLNEKLQGVSYFLSHHRGSSQKFGPTSGQFKGEINGAHPRKRHQQRHLEFCIA
jgi:hypothetical protein